jgi:DNA-binding NarL/FixJ family response regulator
MILDLQGRLLFANGEAASMLPAITDAATQSLPDDIGTLCERLQQGGGDAAAPRIATFGEATYCLRASYMGGPASDSSPAHIMVLMERISEKRAIDWQRAQKSFSLTAREVGVLQQLSLGLANRQIAETLFISELTVKDHLKNIMKKMHVTSRSEILALLR